MALAEDTEIIEQFEEFYRNYYRNEIGELARKYPNDQRSLYISWNDLYRYDQTLAEQYRNRPGQLQEYAEEALRLYDLPVDVSLGQAHVRVRDLPDTTEIRAIRAHHRGQLVSVQGIVRKATDVRPKVQLAAFECQRCGTLTRIPQSGGDFQEPHECQGCERQGPYRINYDESEFVDAQKIRVQESPEGLRGGETPQSIDVHIEDDVTGEVTAGDHVKVVGILHLDQQESQGQKSAMFDVYMEGVSIEIEDEQFEEMDITEEDKKQIISLSDADDIYDQMVASMAPSIFGYDEEKLAIILQMFSGVTKHLPDGSRIRGDFHILLIGDPGTGKCVSGDTNVTLADGSEIEIRELVESHLDDPEPVDDGVYQEVDFEVPSLDTDGSLTHKRATKVWKREAPDNLYRVRTASGHELDVTPSHPLFVQSNGEYVATKAEQLTEGQAIAVTGDVPTMADGGTGLYSTEAPDSGTSGSPLARPVVASPIESIEPVTPDDEWVYDLEIEDTHSYLTNNVVSHNSQLLQYVRSISPRSVYTSGKGSSSAGLCVTGDTMIHTADGLRPIRDVALPHHPEPVADDTAADHETDLYTFDRASGSLERRSSSHVWRMPEKPCCRIETAYGKELETSVNTPLLTCGENGLEWKPMSELKAGDAVAMPKYTDVERSSPSVAEYLELTNEKVRLTDDSIEFLRQGLRDSFGTLRDAAAALDLSEDFIYDSLSNRFIPLDRLDTLLDAIGASRGDVTIRRLMLRHGDDIRVPERFDADLMYLIGLVFGDGDIALSRRGANRGMVRISNGDEALLERAIEIIGETFDKSVEIEYQDDRVPSIRLNSATIARFFANVGMQTPKQGLELDSRLTTAEHADAFLRGLMDADGSVSTRTDGGSSIQFSTISTEFAQQVQLMLETYGVRARKRVRDRRGTTTLSNGHTIESKHPQIHFGIYGRDIETYAAEIGFESTAKGGALEQLVGGAQRRGERMPVGDILKTVTTTSGPYYNNFSLGHDPGRSRARAILAERDLGAAEPIVDEVVEADLVWDEVVTVEDTGEKEVFDLTVPETHNFIGNGFVTHNTAAAVRDDFGDGQQWTLEAGALVLADQGIAAIDELDKMRCVTGETVVDLGEEAVPIGEIARRAAETGTVEPLANGRTIRGFDDDLTVRTMTADERLVSRPVTAVHEYDAPDELFEVTLTSGASVVTTATHPFFVEGEDGPIERHACDLTCEDAVIVPAATALATDGGTVLAEASDRVGAEKAEVTYQPVTTVKQIDSHDHSKVYDLTVEGTHNFVANSMIVHNSEDRSAMHEALEQQSYHPDSEVLLADGRRVRIGPFVDDRMAARPGEVVDGVDCEILPVDDVGVHSVDFETNETAKVPVDRVSRHEAPDEFVRVTFSNGRDVLVTPEHPMFVDDGGEVGTVPADEIEEGAFVPAPRKLPNTSAPVTLDYEPHVGKEKDVTLPEEMTGDLAEILGFLTAEGHSYAGSSHEIGFSNQDERLLERMAALMRDVFEMESTDTMNAAGTVTKRWVSTKLYRWFESNVPEFMHTARDKRIPAKVLGASEECIRRFLVGAFAGDGGVESEAMALSTSSEGLAEDYADALAKIGVASRIHYNSTEDSWKTYVMGDSTERFVDAVIEPADERYQKARGFVDRSNATPRHHDVLPTSAAAELRDLRSTVGLRLTGKFRPNLDEGYGVQVDTVEAELTTIRGRVESVREELGTAESLAEVRAAIGWSGRELADRIGVTASAVHYAEDGGYDAAKRERMTERAREAIEGALDVVERRADALETRCDLRYYRVTDVETVPNAGEYATDWVYDVTVEPTNTFVSQGVVLHNSISVSKAGINATLKSRCALLGAANPKYGRFDEYEAIAEQINLEPALISRFDLIFTITDKPDPDKDRELASHILNTNYAGELHTHRTENATSDYSQEEVDSVTEEVEPAIDAEFLRKYVAYAKRNCFPVMTEEARSEIEEFYVDLRAQGTDGDAPVPVTARKLEGLVRLAEASARVRLSDTVAAEDARRVIDVVRSSMEDIGMDPETGEFDADIVETGTSKTQRDRIRNIKAIIREVEEEYDEGAPVEEVLERAEAAGMEQSQAEQEIEKLRRQGDVYEPSQDHLRTV